MDKRRPPCANVEVINVQSCVSVPVCQPCPPPPSPPPPPPPPPKECTRCNNLLQNPSFEAGLTGWESNNAAVANNPFEGTQASILGPGIASMFQDVSLAGLGNCPLFLSFEVVSNTGTLASNLVAEILWLDANHNTLANGLKILILASRINDMRLTYFDITDRPPTGAAWARILFSKNQGQLDDQELPTVTIEIDQVILTPVYTINLVQNPGFELGLTNWDPTNTIPGFSSSFEGSAQATMEEGSATLFQDVPISDLLANSSFLLSFAAFTLEDTASLSVQVLWLDSTDNEIAPPGLDLFIPQDTLPQQGNYLTYLDITKPAPSGAVKARILFTSDTGGLRIDKVILAKTGSTNLVQNPSFEDGSSNWEFVKALVVTTDTAYEGNQVARIEDISGGALFQDVPITHPAGHCFLFNFGYRRTPVTGTLGNMLAEVRWLDESDREIGLGLSLNTPGPGGSSIWLVYTGITEPAPHGAVKARVQFSHSSIPSLVDLFPEIDKVVLVRLN